MKKPPEPASPVEKVGMFALLFYAFSAALVLVQMNVLFRSYVGAPADVQPLFWVAQSVNSAVVGYLNTMAPLAFLAMAAIGAHAFMYKREKSEWLNAVLLFSAPSTMFIVCFNWLSAVMPLESGYRLASVWWLAA